MGALVFMKLKARGSSYAVGGFVIFKPTACTESRSVREFSPNIFIKRN